VLGYYTSNAELDGKQRKIKITLNSGISATLEYRNAYFGGKDFKTFTTADKERQLEEAFILGDPITEITMALEVNYFQLDSAEYFVPITLKIPGSELAIAKRGGADQTRIDFLGEIRSGGPANNIRDFIPIRLTDATAAELANRPITYDTGFSVLPVANRLNTMPIKLNFRLDALAPGEYSMQVSVLNPNSQKAAFWQAPVMLVP
jgi:hypothetical protein